MCADFVQSAGGKPRVFFHLDYGRDGDDGLSIENPERSPYGFGYCSEFFETSLSNSGHESRLQRFVRRGLAQMLGFDVVHAYKNSVPLSRAEVVVTHTEHEYLAVAALIKFRLIPRVKLIGESIWLWDEWEKFSRLRRLIYRWLLAEVAVHLALSSENATIGSKVLGSRVHFLRYGADRSRHEKVPVRHRDTDSITVLAPGNDRDRDWHSLVKVAENNPGIYVTIASRRLRARLAARNCPQRVSVVSVDSDAQMHDLLSRHDVVAVPLKPNRHVSGITVMFEAILTHRPAAVTRTGGLGDYGEGLVSWAEPLDDVSLHSAIVSANSFSMNEQTLEERADDLVRRGLTIADFGLRHVVAVWMAIGHSVDAELLSLGEPIYSHVKRIEESFFEA